MQEAHKGPARGGVQSAVSQVGTQNHQKRARRLLHALPPLPESTCAVPHSHAHSPAHAAPARPVPAPQPFPTPPQKPPAPRHAAHAAQETIRPGLPPRTHRRTRRLQANRHTHAYQVAGMGGSRDGQAPPMPQHPGPVPAHCWVSTSTAAPPSPAHAMKLKPPCCCWPKPAPPKV